MTIYNAVSVGGKCGKQKIPSFIFYAKFFFKKKKLENCNSFKNKFSR